MSRLDVEQQLRERQKKEAQDAVATRRYVTWQNYQAVADVALFVMITTMCIVLYIVAGQRRMRGAQHWSIALQKAQAGLFSSFLSPFAVTLFMILWCTLTACSSIVALMQSVARNRNETRTTPWWQSAPLYMYVSESAGIALLYTYLRRASANFGYGALTCLMIFFPTFYKSMTVRDDDPERAAVWITHVSFLISLFTLASFATPWLRREYHRAVELLNTHTEAVLYSDKKELKELIAREQKLKRH